MRAVAWSDIINILEFAVFMVMGGVGDMEWLSSSKFDKFSPPPFSSTFALVPVKAVISLNGYPKISLQDHGSHTFVLSVPASIPPASQSSLYASLKHKAHNYDGTIYQDMVTLHDDDSAAWQNIHELVGERGICGPICTSPPTFRARKYNIKHGIY